MQRNSFICIFLILIFFNSCIPYISECPITNKAEFLINDTLVGEWNIKNESGVYKIFIEKIDDKNFTGTYFRLNEKNSQLTNINTGTGYISKINNKEYLNIKVVLGDSTIKKKYVFYKYEIVSKDTIKLSNISGLKFNTKFQLAKEFEECIKENQDSFDLFFEPIGIATREIQNDNNPQLTCLTQALDFIDPIIFPEEVKNDFMINKSNIYKAKKYFKSILKKNFEIYIEFKDYHKIDFWVFKRKKENLEKIIQVWDTDFNSKEIQDVVSILDWNNYEMIILREKLFSANCISISNLTDGIEVGYKRSGMGKYSYDIFDKPIAKKDWGSFNDSCQYIMIDSLTVINYGGPAFGSQCMPLKK